MHHPPSTYAKGVTIETPEEGETFNNNDLFDVTGIVRSPANVVDLTVEYVEWEASTFPSGLANAYEAVDVVASGAGSTITVTVDYDDGSIVVATRNIIVIVS